MTEYKNKRFNGQVVQFVVVLLASLFLNSCGEEVSPSSPRTSPPPDQFSAALPLPLQKIFNAGTLKAELVVDGGAPIALSIEANRVIGAVENLSAGNHTFTINYFLNNIPVATATTTGTIIAGVTTPISFTTIRYLDSDGDGFTNLAELESGTDPNTSTSRPPAEMPRFSANYVMSDVVGTTPFVGTSTSENYSLTTGL